MKTRNDMPSEKLSEIRISPVDKHGLIPYYKGMTERNDTQGIGLNEELRVVTTNPTKRRTS